MYIRMWVMSIIVYISVNPAVFNTFFNISMATNVTARDARV